MNPFTRIGHAVKSLFTGGIRFSGHNGYSWSNLGATSHNFSQSVGNPAQNGIISAIVSWMQRTYPEAPLRVMQVDTSGEKTELRDHPLARLLRKPNGWYSARLLWSATIADFAVSGNAYWIKVRGVGGRVVELWWVPSNLMEPRWPDDETTFISHYDYKINGRPIQYAPEDVVHFRDGLDPQNQRKGLSVIAGLLREVATDNEAANWSASLLRNMGVPGVVIAPSKDIEMQPEDAEIMKTQWMQKFGGDRKGDPLVMSSPTTVSVLSFSPQQMDMKALRRVPEERITAAMGIPAIVIGLGAGLEHATYSNYDTALTAAYVSNVIPTQGLFADELLTQLVTDFDTTDSLLVEHDYSDVRVLQTDVNNLYKRAVEALQGGLITRNTALQMIGEPPEEGVGGDVLYVSTRVTPMLADDLLALREMPARVTIADPASGANLPPTTPDRLRILPPTSEDNQPAEAFGGKSARVRAMVRKSFTPDMADAVLLCLAEPHPGVSDAEHGRTVVEQARELARAR